MPEFSSEVDKTEDLDLLATEQKLWLKKPLSILITPILILQKYKSPWLNQWINSVINSL